MYNTTRLNQLTERYDRLLDANNRHQYARTRPDKYFAILLELKRLRTAEMRKQDATLDKSKYKVKFTPEMMFNLTSPDFLD